jgi:hypothetical protein
MSAQATRPTPNLALFDETAAVIERERALFVARNADLCSHLLVRMDPGGPGDDLVIRAAFTLDGLRTWHQVEARVPRCELSLESGPDRGVITAFGRLDDGIGAARIARLFAPLTAAQRMATGRN